MIINLKVQIINALHKIYFFLIINILIINRIDFIWKSQVRIHFFIMFFFTKLLKEKLTLPLNLIT
jgi:hypothetical protein